jgi:hypothetical protein
MRQFSRLALLLLLVLSIAPPAGARIAMIQTMAPLQDHAEQPIEAAFKEALETAVKGAVAMGLSWVKLGRALVLENMVVVQIFATDTRLAGEDESSPGGGSAPGPANLRGGICEECCAGEATGHRLRLANLPGLCQGWLAEFEPVRNRPELPEDGKGAQSQDSGAEGGACAEHALPRAGLLDQRISTSPPCQPAGLPQA